MTTSSTEGLPANTQAVSPKQDPALVKGQASRLRKRPEDEVAVQGSQDLQVAADDPAAPKERILLAQAEAAAGAAATDAAAAAPANAAAADAAGASSIGGAGAP